MNAERPVDLKPHALIGLQEQTDIWERIRRGFAMPDLDNDLVRNREQWYASRPDYMLRMTERSRPYLFHVVEELERRNMPTAGDAQLRGLRVQQITAGQGQAAVGAYVEELRRSAKVEKNPRAFQ